MRLLPLPALLLFFISCDPGDTSVPVVSTEHFTPPPTDTTTWSAPKYAAPSYSMIRSVDSLLELGYALAGKDTFVACKLDALFSLNDPNSVFQSREMVFLGQSSGLRSSLVTPDKKHTLHIEEWSFVSKEDAYAIVEALGKPLSSKSEQRFKSAPFTFWDHENIIVHLFTEEEDGRKFMDAAANVLTYFQQKRQAD